MSNSDDVPAQEAPRDAGICGKIGTVGYQQVRCTRLKGHDHLCAQLTPDGLYALDFVPAEPQAGAQVPSQGLKEAAKAVLYAVKCDGYPQFTEREEDAFRALAKVLGEELGEPISVYEHTDKKVARLQAHLNTICNYATEAAKTPITREDMHDPLKAQTFYDEAKGFERLVLSEIGGGK